MRTTAPAVFSCVASRNKQKGKPRPGLPRQIQWNSCTSRRQWILLLFISQQQQRNLLGFLHDMARARHRDRTWFRFSVALPLGINGHPPRATAMRVRTVRRVNAFTSAIAVTTGLSGFWIRMRNFCGSVLTGSARAASATVPAVFSCVASRNKRGVPHSQWASFYPNAPQASPASPRPGLPRCRPHWAVRRPDGRRQRRVQLGGHNQRDGRLILELLHEESHF